MMKTEQLLEDLRRRAAVKRFDVSQPVSEFDLETILEAAVLTPSSFGVQPRKIVAIRDHALRQELRKHSYDQTQITTCSHLLVLCGLTEVSDTYIDELVDYAIAHDGEQETFENYRSMLKQQMADKRTAGTLEKWISDQVYILLGNIIHTCARMRIDAAPMEGFSREQYDEVLGLAAQGCHALVLCALGYRSSDDTRSQQPKVRRPLEQIVFSPSKNSPEEER